jgi:GTPase SAR1 family protein
MGEKLSKPETKRVNEPSTNKERKIRILLLGTGESGKTSIFKQLKKFYQDEPYTEEELQQFRNSIYSNIFQSTQILSRDCIEKNPKDPFDDPENLNRAKKIEEMGMWSILTNGLEKYTPEFHQMIGEIWKENSLAEKFQSNEEDLQVSQNLQYFLDRFEKLTPPYYIPSMDDILHCQRKTNGISSLKSTIKSVDLSIYDIGGSRSSRRMWHQCN